MWTLADFDVCLNGGQLPHFASVCHFLCQEAYPETAHPRNPLDRLKVLMQVQECEQIVTFSGASASPPSLPQLGLCLKAGTSQGS